MAVFFGAYAIYKATEADGSRIDTASILIYGLGSIFYLVYGLRLMGVPRVEVDETRIWSKTSIFSKPQEFLWTGIREISFGSYQVTFNLDAGPPMILRLNTTLPEVSIAVKDAITRVAEEKSIPVHPG